MDMLIGFTEKRGVAWQTHRGGTVGGNPNSYPGPVPVGEVRRRLFDWEPVEIPLSVTAEDGRVFTDPTRKVLAHPKTGKVLGVHGVNRPTHSYGATLLDTTREIIGGRDLHISSAGTAKGGARAWVQIETEATWFAQGVEFRPYLFGATSHDASLSSVWGVGNNVFSCDNMVSGAWAGSLGQRWKVRHTSQSLSKMRDGARALMIIEEVGEDFQRAIEALVADKVTPTVANKFIDVFSGLATKGKDAEPSKGLTLAQTKKEALLTLWNRDERVTPWKGTAFGIVQMVNTYEHHFAHARGQDKAERNMIRMMTPGKGSVEAMDSNTLKVLASVR